jgi:hypothetical protein
MFKFLKNLFSKLSEIELLRKKYSHLVDDRFWEIYEIFKIYDIVDYRLVKKGAGEEYLYIRFNDRSDTIFMCISNVLSVSHGTSVIYSRKIGIFHRHYDCIQDGKLPDYKAFLGYIFSGKIKNYLLEKSI